MANKTMMCQILSYVASNLILKNQDSKYDIKKSINLVEELKNPT